MVNTSKASSLYNSPLMTSANPFRKNMQQELLKDDSCIKFKMKETVMTGKTEALERDSRDSIDSPMLKKSMMPNGQILKESRFGEERKMNAERQEDASY